MGRRLLLWLVLPAGLAVGLFLLLYQPVAVMSAGMSPSVRAGDRVAVSRFAYGDRKGVWARLGGPLGLFQLAPRRGEVIVIRYPGRFWSLRGERQVRRVVGVAGDRIELRGGVLHLNGTAAARSPLPGASPPDAPQGAQRLRETLPGPRSYEILQIADRRTLDDVRSFIVPPGHLFVLGDNRDAVEDSRSEGGLFVPLDSVIGRAELVLWSLDDGAALWEVWRWPASFRGERFAKAVR